MTVLIGTASYQVPTNGDLGTMAFQDSAAVSVGLLAVSGNLSIGGSTSIGNLFISNTNASISSSTGVLILNGGLGVSGNIFATGSGWLGNLTITNSTASTSTATGALTVPNGGIGVGGSVWASNFNPTSSTVPTAGLYLSAANTLSWSTAGSQRMTLSSSGYLLLGTSVTASGSSGTVVVNNAAGGGIELVNNNSGGGNISALNAGGLSISTFTGAVGSETYSNRITISSTGNVGINTTNPLALLTVGAGSLTDSNVPIQMSANGSIAYLGVNRSNGAYGALFGWDSTLGGTVIRSVNGADNMSFLINSGTRAITIISPTGNVGIGTTLPSQLLDVTGSTLLRSNLTVLGNSSVSGSSWTGNLSITNTTTSTSTTTGALTVAGGIGVAGNIVIGGAISFSVANNLSAAGTNQATATQLSADTNIITTVASGTGVVLPTGIGREITVINRGANALLVYPSVGYSIDGAAANAATSVPPLGWLTVDCVSTTNYFTVDPVYIGGADTTITESNNGTITIASTSTLATVTGRGATTGSTILLTGTANAISSSTGVLQVTGGIGVGGSVYFGGNVFLADNNGSNVNRIYTASISDTNHFIYSTGTGGNQTFFGEYSSWYFYNTSNNSNAVIISGNGQITANSMVLNNTTTSTSTTTGALVVGGGVGIGGALYVSGALTSGEFIPTSSAIPSNGVYLPAANTLGFATNGAERIQVDQYGNVSIGTNTIALGVNGRNSLTISGSSTSLIGLQTGSTLNGYIWNDGTNLNLIAVAGQLIHQTQTSSPMVFQINSSEKMRLLSGGQLSIGSTAAPSGSSVMLSVNTSSGTTGGMQLIANNNGGVAFNGVSGGGLQIYTATGAVGSESYAQRMTIDNNGNVGIGTTTMSYNFQVNGNLAATTKSFVINHPTKPSWKLRYASLEGPENGVYLRGKLENSNQIDLPDYWSTLVDIDSITVHLTSIKKHQSLYVVDITDKNILIKSNSKSPIRCFYTVYAERKDVDKLITEYQV